jgi:hypothetical protein
VDTLVASLEEAHAELAAAHEEVDQEKVLRLTQAETQLFELNELNELSDQLSVECQLYQVLSKMLCATNLPCNLGCISVICCVF